MFCTVSAVWVLDTLLLNGSDRALAAMVTEPAAALGVMVTLLPAIRSTLPFCGGTPSTLRA